MSGELNEAPTNTGKTTMIASTKNHEAVPNANALVQTIIGSRLCPDDVNPEMNEINIAAITEH